MRSEDTEIRIMLSAKPRDETYYSAFGVIMSGMRQTFCGYTHDRFALPQALILLGRLLELHSL